MDRKNVDKCLILVGVAAAIGLALPRTAFADTQVVTIEKPVVLQSKEKVFEKQVLVQKSAQRSGLAPRRRLVAYRPMARACAPKARISSAARSSFTKIVEKTTEKPIMVEKPVMIDRTVEKPVYIEKTVEKPVFIEKQVEVEKPAVLEKEVQVEQPAVIEQQPTVIEQKPGHHLLNLKLF